MSTEVDKKDDKLEKEDQVRVVASESQVTMASMMIGMAAKADARPPWFRETGMDEAELLLYGSWDEDEEDEEDEDAPEPQVAVLQGPSSNTMEAIEAAVMAGRKDKEKEATAQTALMTEMLISLPKEMTAKRGFTFENVVILEKGASLVPPADLELDEVPKKQRPTARKRYVRKVLPNRLYQMCLTAAWIMAMPNLAHLVDEKKEGEPPVGPTSEEE